MKRLFKLLLAAVLTLGAATACYDDSTLKSDISDLKNRVKTLEDMMSTANGNISTLQDLVSALNGKVYVSSVTETTDGWTIVFSDGKTAKITNGISPRIGILKDTDGVYYWTLDGEWLVGAYGEKLRVTGQDGKPGADAIAPQLKIDGDYWYISTDGGTTWTQLGKATGADGKDAEGIFQWVNWDESFWYFALANGDIIRIGRGVYGAKSLTAIPEWSDGSVSALDEEFTVCFDVLPPEAAEGLASESNDIFSFKVVYTAITKASESVILPIVSKEGKDGTLLLTVDGSKLNENFLNGISGASACLSVVYNDNVISSGYFPLKFYIPYGGHAAVDLGLPSGLLWATMNVGATKPEETGDYFAWGETEPKSYYSWDTYKWGPKNKLARYNYEDHWIRLIPDDDAATANWGDLWRMPTTSEASELHSKCTFKKIIVNEVSGVEVTGPNGNTIFFPQSGYMDSDGLKNYEDGLYFIGLASSFGPNTGLSRQYADLPHHLAWGYIFSDFSCNGYVVRPVYGTIRVQSISITGSVNLNVGNTQIIHVTFVPKNATYSNLTWISSDKSVATVDYDGKVTAVSAGKATITAISGDGGKTATCAVTVKDPYNGHEYVDLGLPSGLKWATCNVGATKPEGYGSYYAWGETEPKTNYYWDTYKWCNGDENKLTKYCTDISRWNSSEPMDYKTALDLEDDAASANWGGSWRMPTNAEWQELKENCTWINLIKNGVDGRLVTGPNGNSIFLPAPGCRYSTGLNWEGDAGFYWSTSLYTSYPEDATYCYIDSDSIGIYSAERFWGYSVRAVCE